MWLLLICSSLSGQSQGKNESGGQSVPRPKPPSDPTIRNLELRKDTSADSLAKLYLENETDSKSGEWAAPPYFVLTFTFWLLWLYIFRHSASCDLSSGPIPRYWKWYSSPGTFENKNGNQISELRWPSNILKYFNQRWMCRCVKLSNEILFPESVPLKNNPARPLFPEALQGHQTGCLKMLICKGSVKSEQVQEGTKSNLISFVNLHMLTYDWIYQNLTTNLATQFFFFLRCFKRKCSGCSCSMQDAVDGTLDLQIISTVEITPTKKTSLEND